MKGQWFGSYHGGAQGQAMINVDEVDDHYEGVAYVNPSTRDIPASVAHWKTKNKDPVQVLTAYVNPVDPRTYFQRTWEDIKHLYADSVVHSSEATVNLTLRDSRLYVGATGNAGVAFAATLERSEEGYKSKIAGQKMSWGEFRAHVSSIAKSKNLLFRGQQEPWRLCTSFHRRGRYRVNAFTNNDVKDLHRRLSAITSHFFDLNQPDQNGAFFNLVQHHGYPTPLLDWTYSPYVAAFFAFRGRPIGYKGDGVVRIYIFDNSEWQKRFPQIMYLDPPFPHLSVLEFIAIDNPRVVPQQAVTTATNIYDIEAYVLNREKETSVQYLQAIDIPANEREDAMRDLRFMGITAGSMFPGIDGVCEELRERNFDR